MKRIWAILLGIALTATSWAAEQSYFGVAPQTDGAADWRYMLVLRDNGSAALHTAKAAFKNSIENAVWTKTVAGEISLQFVWTNGRPRGTPLVMKFLDGQLTPLTWDKANWGEAGPPKLRKG